MACNSVGESTQQCMYCRDAIDAALGEGECWESCLPP